ncbi:thioredoxin domain-containing protein 15 [Megalobrama amblycephala]|uniref:thioredoxin domain-containing protein 15 n=1 Tax=Megalobrama amblycephala TaxID=75352 RepID=UPI0020147B4C|nr:thioredoxin domain-containing protein 15 [Megalobrama amblycephala]XP_048022632.1 thioredoxin domain-containing protein 15 [Megalobrama amblycephala]XP_048022633.1 thioredoxin domain-containing protein 15 [Megalobrama amblycephala]
MIWTHGLALPLMIAALVRLTHGGVGEEPDPSDPPQRRFKTAEMADAVMETAPSPAGMQHLIPKELLGEPCAEEEKPLLSAVIHTDTSDNQNQNFTETAKTYKVTCDRRNISGIARFTVHVLNASQDLMELLNANSSECSLVLFYTPWCQFSAGLAPHFNALPRVFPSMHFLALDASQHSSLSTRFGTVAVPNILLFQGAKPMARFNQTDRTLDTLTSFITNQTGFEASPDQSVQEDDRVGPLPAVPVKSIDWLFVFSVLFISGFTLYAILCTDSIRWLIPGQDHEHQD